MTVTFEVANEKLRSAVKARMDATPKDDPKMVGYKPAVTEPVPEVAAAEDSEQDEWADFTMLRGDSLLKEHIHPTSQAYFNLLDRMKALHSSKSRDYGSEHDPLANIRNGALFVGIEPWKGAMVRLSDKVTRLATFNRTGRLEHEGVEDNLMDLASYALLALLLYREEHGGSPD
jgi:hypothetical protein